MNLRTNSKIINGRVLYRSVGDFKDYQHRTNIVKDEKGDLLVDSKEIGLEVNADKTKYMILSRDQNEGRSQNIRTGNSSFESVEEFKYLGTTLTNQNSIQEENKSGLKSRECLLSFGTEYFVF